MKTKILFLIATLLSSQNLWAQNEVTIIENKEAIYKDSSEYGRMNKKFSIQYQGGITADVGASGIVAAYFLDRNLLVQAEFMGSNGEGKRSTWGTSADRHEELENINSFGLHLKKFLGNSFYVNSGLDWIRRDYRYSYKSSLAPTYNASRSFETQGLNAAFVIGNQWQWDNFTIGCDWLGISAPLAFQKVTSESVNSSDYDYDMARMREKQDELKTRVQFSALRLSLGWSF
jgi:hypothetical protein